MSEKRVRVLFAITELDVGGAEKALFEIATRLDPSRFLPQVVPLVGDGEVGRWLEARGVPVTPLRMRGKADVGALLRLARLLRNLRIDLLQTFLFHANLLGRVAARLAGTPAVVSAVRVAEGERRFHLALDRWTCGWVDAVTANAEELSRFCRDEARLPAPKVRTIPNGVDFEKYLRPALPATPLPIRPGDRVLVAVGRLSRQKGLVHLLAAMDRVITVEPAARLLLVGKGEEEQHLRAAVPERARGRVEFLGWRPDVPAILQAAEALVLPSLWEGMPNVVLEAMAAARPVVASAVGGAVDLVRDGETGLLVPPADPASLGDAILRLLAEPARARAMGVAGRERARREYSWDRTAAAYQALYEEVLAKKHGSTEARLARANVRR
ncbi:MAG: glycosyltransferase [Planctomycetes bacterium]|nr:glycosyltransferase [Planctomycetota bacterium]